MRFGLCRALSRLWIRLVVKTVLPERLSPVTASHTVEPAVRSARLKARNSRSEVSTTIGGTHLIFTLALDLRACVRKWACHRGSASGRGRAPHRNVRHARPSRSRTGVFRPLRLVGDAGR